MCAGRERAVCKRAEGLSDTLGDVHQEKHVLFLIQGNIATGDASGRQGTRREWGEGTDRREQPQPEVARPWPKSEKIIAVKMGV